MNIHVQWLSLILATSIGSCEPEWIADPINPGLPKYTEEGLGVAGALVNGDLWEAKLECAYGFLFDPTICTNELTIESKTDGTLSVHLDGDMADGRVLEFEFLLNGCAAAYQANKTSLHNTKFTIDGFQNKVTIKDSFNSCFNGKIGTGQLYFMRVMLRPDGTVIDLSGTFGFEVEDATCGRYEVYYGRFDYALWD